MFPVIRGSELYNLLGSYGRGRRRRCRSGIDILKAVSRVPCLVGGNSRSCKALRAAETCYRTIVEDLTEPLCRLSPDGTVTYANAPFISLCSRERGEVIGMPVLDVLPPDIAGELSAWAGPPDAANPVVTREFRIAGSDDERWYLTVCRAILDNVGGVCGYQVVAHDATAQKTREQALREKTERTDTLLRIAAQLNGSAPLDAVLDTLCEETARVLGAQTVVVFSYDRSRDLLVPIRSSGMPEEARGCVPCIPWAIYEREILGHGRVIAIYDPVPRMSELSWTGPPEKLPRTLASATILYEKTLIGALEVVTFDAPHRFSPEELVLLKGIADLAALAMANARHFEDRIAYERRLQASLDEKAALLKEVHHRVKNNMQVISSLLSLQGRMIENAGVRECVRESENRVRSLALVHECLYRSDSIAAVDIGAYARRLADGLIRSYALQVQISVNVETTETIALSGDEAVPLGLILNELISNSLRHGFVDRREGAIAIRTARLPDRRLVIDYRDDGVGIPPDVISRPPVTLGLQLVRILTEQLDGTVAFRRGEPGTIVEIVVADGAGKKEI